MKWKPVQAEPAPQSSKHRTPDITALLASHTAVGSEHKLGDKRSTTHAQNSSYAVPYAPSAVPFLRGPRHCRPGTSCRSRSPLPRGAAMRLVYRLSVGAGCGSLARGLRHHLHAPAGLFLVSGFLPLRSSVGRQPKLAAPIISRIRLLYGVTFLPSFQMLDRHPDYTGCPAHQLLLLANLEYYRQQTSPVDTHQIDEDIKASQ